MGLSTLVRPAYSAALLLGLSLSAAVAAQDATPIGEQPGLPPLPAGCAVVADGLASPRYVALGDDGTIYVTEAGFGGDQPLGPAGPPEATPVADGEVPVDAAATPVAEGATPVPEDGPPASTRGYTGRVTAISPDGTQSVLVDGLASYSDGVGPTGIVFVDGQLYVSIGGAGAGAGIEPLPEENTIYRIDPATGEATLVASIGQYEVDNNPDGADINPNLYGLAAGDDGTLYVADAGGNTIYAVDPATGGFELEAVVPGLSELTGVSLEGDAPDRQAVPTGLAVDDEGTLHVALLSEAWEGPSILTLEEDGSFSPVASNLSTVVGLAVGPDGAVYASQLTTDFANFAPGNVVRVAEDGSTEVAVDGLVIPHGIAFDDAGNLYVVVNSVPLGPGAPAGQVLRCEGVAGPGGAAGAVEAGTPVAVLGRDA